MPNISIEPPSTSLGPGETCRFRVMTSAEIALHLSWEIVSPGGMAGEALGTINQEGVYSAPAQITAQTQVTVRATADGDTADAVVTLRPGGIRDELSAERADLRVIPPVKVTPGTAVLGAGQTVKFRAMDASQKPVSVTWTLAGADGLGPEMAGRIDPMTSDYTLYTAPREVTVQRFITVTATVAGVSDKAFVVLAPGKVTVIPGEAVLRAGELQVFQARVSGDPNEQVTWAAPSPSIGSLDGKGAYKAPDKVSEDQTVMITAIAKVSGDQGHARITLLADEWKGWKPKALGIGLLLLFVLVFIVYYVWPPPLDRSKLNAAKAAQATAQRVLEQRQAALDEAKTQADGWGNQLADAEKNIPNPQAAAAPALEALRLAKRNADESVRTRTVEVNLAAQDLKDKSAAVKLEEDTIRDATADERSLFLLVVLAGALGSFVHVTRSYADFVGNRRLRPSWTWWYILQPLTGSALAVVVYLVIRGGFFVGASEGGILNPFGFVAVASLVGLFSKQATNKLDELFSTMFRTDKERELKDKLDAGAPQARAESQGTLSSG